MANPEEMYQCQTLNCGYIYNPDKGDRKGKIPAGTKFHDIPDTWRCPICGASKAMFKPLAGSGSVLEENTLSTQDNSTETIKTKEIKEDGNMKKYRCTICGYVYDPVAGDPGAGIPPGTPFESLPADWVCPICGAKKDDFEPEA